MRKTLVAVSMTLMMLTACTSQPKPDLTHTTYAMGTVISINLYDQGDQALMDKLVEKVYDIEWRMSLQKAESEVNAVKAAAGKSPVQVSKETYRVVEKALEYAALSDGRFDPTIGPIVQLWGIGTEEARVPSPEEIEEALAYVDYRQVVLDEGAMTIYLPIEGMVLDLGGIAKGYAADELVRILEETSTKRAMLSLGGNIYAYGNKEDGNPFNIAIQTPYDSRNTYFGYVSVSNKTVVTSGPYERYIEVEGAFYHHIFNASTGYPTEGDVISVTVVSDHSMDADALSTMLFTMSPEEGLTLVESIDGVDCIYVDREFGLTLSSGVQDIFTLTDDKYFIR